MKNLWILLLVALISCNDKKIEYPTEVPTLNASFGKYISSYSKQSIDVNEQLTIRFSGAVVDVSEIGKMVDNDQFSITPAVDGKAYWKNNQTLIFEPSETLEYAKEYVVSVGLGTLFEDVPTDLQTAQIHYVTNPLNLRVTFDNINYGSSTNDKWITLTGRIRTNNIIDNQSIEKILKASQNGNDELTIAWQHYSLKNRNFEIQNIKRSKKTSQLVINWDATDHQAQATGTRKLEILPIGAFKYIATEASNNPRTILLSFSDQLNVSQDLTGLIKVNGSDKKIKYEKRGSVLTLFLDAKVKSPINITLDKNIQRANGDKLDETKEIVYNLDPPKPRLDLIGDGVIVPYSDEASFPFVATNLKSASLEIFKIYQDNVLQFLQNNDINSNYSLYNVGTIVHQQKIDIDPFNKEADGTTKRVALNLRDYINMDMGAIYQIRIAFDQSDVVGFDCNQTDDQEPFIIKLDKNRSILNQRGRYDREHRDDPCYPSFYKSSKYIYRNLLASDLGIIIKKSQNHTVYTTLTNLKTIAPISDAIVSYYDFQQQLISSTKTDDNGQASLKIERNPSFAIVTANNQYGYVNMQDRHSNSLSEFDVSGKNKKKGIDGFIYTERGVRRPGDTLHINFVLEDATHQLPDDHPVKINIKDSRGKNKYTATTTNHTGGIYNYRIPTHHTDPTGNWSASITVGDNIFYKTIKVETVKPNRLKIEYDLPNDNINLKDNSSITITSEWLHGAPADGLKAKVDMQLVSVPTRFQYYSKYQFDDPARKIEAIQFTIHDKPLDENGSAQISITKDKKWMPPGKLRANLKTKVYEKSGNFSEDNFSTEADLYDSYVGLQIPKTRWGSAFVEKGKTTNIPIVTLDKNGKKVGNRNLYVGLYTARWSWWYDEGYSNKYNYNSALHNGAVIKEKIKSNAEGEAVFQLKMDDEYGNYMIRICDEDSGHCTGGMFYTGRSWSNMKDRQGPQLLQFEADKKEYSVGEKIKIDIPSNKGAKIFVSIENGTQVLQSYWVDADKKTTRLTIPTSKDMSPNIYVHAHLVQQHNQKGNDLPMRMYGVLPIKVVDSNTVLQPIIIAPDEVRPDAPFDISVSENNGNEMYYTIAIVDEGLLALTRFKTPDIWSHFYAKQALGIKTWDIYDQVLNGYGGEIDHLISIGGDADSGANNKGTKANRFKPVVQHLGPFKLNEKGQNKHSIKIDNYVGAVRAMVVARKDMTYGKTDKSIKVKKPLMLQATLPRVLGPQESFSIPANVFAMDKKIKDVSVSIDTDALINLQGSNTNSLNFDKPGDKLSYFDIKVGDQVGISKIKLNAKSGSEQSSEEVEIDIRNANPIISRVEDKALAPGAEWIHDYATFGTDGTNQSVLEVSSIAPINLEKRLQYLMRYPYGCIEQTVSSVFPQLYLKDLTDMSAMQIHKTEQNIQRAIERLSLFQLSNGAMSYWPGNTDASEWGSTYALHFLLESKDRKFYVPASILDNLSNYLDAQCNQYSPARVNSNNYWKPLQQAYRLYTLAKAGVPNIGAMNRLKSFEGLNVASAHLLAGAYALIGKKQIAAQLISNSDRQIKPYIETGYTYGSHIRDMGIMVETLLLLDNSDEAVKLINTLSKELSSSRWYSTQSTSFALLSIGKFVSKYPKSSVTFSWSADGSTMQTASSEKPIFTQNLKINADKNHNLTVKNTSEGYLYIKRVLSGQEPPGTKEEASQKHLKLKVSYKDLIGATIDPTNLKQGTDFMAVVEVTNLGTKGKRIDELALTQIFPSGWEIQNSRLSSMESFTSESNYEYRDIRDDRVNTFFDFRGVEKRTYTTLLTATFAGKFYMPPTYVQAMYDREIQAKNKGKWITVSANQ